MQVVIALSKELTPNAQQAEDREIERKKQEEYGDLPPDEIAKREKDKEDDQKKKEEEAKVEPPKDLGKFKTEAFESFNDQTKHVDAETNRNL